MRFDQLAHLRSVVRFHLHPLHDGVGRKEEWCPRRVRRSRNKNQSGAWSIQGIDNHSCRAGGHPGCGAKADDEVGEVSDLVGSGPEGAFEHDRRI